MSISSLPVRLAYLSGCHSMRHMVGGCVDQLSRAPLGVRAHSSVSCLDSRHMGFSDLYVRLCSMGVWSDIRFF